MRAAPHVRLLPILLTALIAAAPAGAATTTVEVTRFHLLAPPAPPLTGMSIAIEPAEPAAAPAPLSFGALAATVSTALAKAGLRPVASGQPADLVARVGLAGTSSQVARRAPFSIGIGGSTGGWRGGVGGGFSLPIGGGVRTVTTAELTIQIRRSADNQAVWEGRASATAPGSDPMGAAPALASALLNPFPGPSGQTIKTRVKTAP